MSKFELTGQGGKDIKRFYDWLNENCTPHLINQNEVTTCQN